MKPNGVTIQMKALNDFFLLVVFMLLLSKLYVFAIFMLNWREKHGSEWVNFVFGYSSNFMCNFVFQFVLHNFALFCSFAVLCCTSRGRDVFELPHPFNNNNNNNNNNNGDDDDNTIKTTRGYHNSFFLMMDI